MSALTISVIISTYNSEEWLRKVLEGYMHQDYKQYEVIVADDGSRDETRQLIASFQNIYPVPLRHIWHEDKGYRRQRILNEAITKASSEYILFTDGDCIPRKDFVSVHAKFAEKGYFLSGGYCKLPMKTSEAISKEAIETGNCFTVKWLKQHDKLKGTQSLKLNSGPKTATILDLITPTNASFNNCNSSAWKEDLLAINGYDERMQYGGPDRELGERLENYGLKSKQIRHKAICLHLDHARGYKTKESLERNLAIRKDTKKSERFWTEHGIQKNSQTPSISVIVSTYNQPQWLRKALWGFECQTEKNFEIVIADDGSTPDTLEMIDAFKEKSPLKIAHVWQEDKGFRKTVILNKAIQASRGEYIIFTDGDCIPRYDFVATHKKHRKPGCFLSAGYFKLPMSLSKKITKEDIVQRNCFDAKWLLKQGLKKNFKINKLTSQGTKEKFLNAITPTSPTWDGNNVSGWRKDILSVNGFDERMQYGGEDRELGERLMNKGIKPIQIRYSTVTVHLDHPRGYVTEDMIVKNKAIRKQTKKSRSVWTIYGIEKKKNE